MKKVKFFSCCQEAMGIDASADRFLVWGDSFIDVYEAKNLGIFYSFSPLQGNIDGVAFCTGNHIRWASNSRLAALSLESYSIHDLGRIEQDYIYALHHGSGNIFIGGNSNLILVDDQHSLTTPLEEIHKIMSLNGHIYFGGKLDNQLTKVCRLKNSAQPMIQEIPGLPSLRGDEVRGLVTDGYQLAYATNYQLVIQKKKNSRKATIIDLDFSSDVKDLIIIGYDVYVVRSTGVSKVNNKGLELVYEPDREGELQTGYYMNNRNLLLLGGKSGVMALEK